MLLALSVNDFRISLLSMPLQMLQRLQNHEFHHFYFYSEIYKDISPSIEHTYGLLLLKQFMIASVSEEQKDYFHFLPVKI